MAGRGTRAQTTPRASVIHIKGPNVNPSAVLAANDANDDVDQATDLLKLLYDRFETLEKSRSKVKDKEVLMKVLSDGKWLKGINSLPTPVQQWFYGDRQSALSGN